MTVVHLARHGQSTWNAAGLMQGQVAHPPLTVAGRRQAERLGRRLCDLLRGACGTRLLTSDAVRAVQTATIVAAATGLEPQPCAALREQHRGVQEGQPCGAVAAGAVPVGGESPEQVAARVADLLESERVLATPGALVLVTHGDTLRITVALLLGADLASASALPVPNGALVSIDTGARELIDMECRA